MPFCKKFVKILAQCVEGGLCFAEESGVVEVIFEEASGQVLQREVVQASHVGFMLGALGFDVALEDFIADGVASCEPPIVGSRGRRFAGKGTFQAVEDDLLHFLGRSLDEAFCFGGVLLRATRITAAELLRCF